MAQYHLRISTSFNSTSPLSATRSPATATANGSFGTKHAPCRGRLSLLKGYTRTVANGPERTLPGFLVLEPVNSPTRITPEKTIKSGRGRTGRRLSRGQVAERKGFEPSRRLQTAYSLSRGAPSTARPPLQERGLSATCPVCKEYSAPAKISTFALTCGRRSGPADNFHRR